MQPTENRDFVKKLYDILEDTKYEQYIKWSDTGTTFYIINPVEFSEKVLDKFFRHSKLSSFIRQLNKYDFHKIKSSKNVVNRLGPQVLEFEHMYFQKNSRNQLYKIKRKSSSTENPTQISDLLPGVESNFIFQNHVISTIKDLSDKFQVLIENVNEMKSKLNELSVSNNNKSISVLVYDEDPNMAMHVYTLLRNQKMSVSVIDSKINLYSILKSNTFNFIILSANIGFFSDVMRYFRSFDFMTPVIYIGFDNTEFDMYSIGVTDFIKKPFTYSEFFFVVSKYLSKNN
ncbi:hypothetical protein P3W45_000730 [Vairimorpha bombi]|jgi:hypothetical protein